MKKIEKPELGNMVIAWNEDKAYAVIGILQDIVGDDYPYRVGEDHHFENIVGFKSIEQYKEFIK